jgi:putative intracellular protease/amidase
MASPPIHYVLPIFPGFQLLDLAGPLDILNLLSTAHLDPEKHPLSLTFIAESLEPVPVKPIPPKSANWTFDLLDAYPSSGGKTNLSFNEYLQPDTTYADYLKALALDEGKTRVDVLLIPGGVGTRLKRVHPDGSKTSNIQSLLEFVPKVAPHIRTAIITVCTGSDALARTGLLDNRRATTNMTRFKEVAARSPKVKWADFARWVRSLPSEVEDSKTHPIEIWTSAGISAGMDVTLAFISHFYGGPEVARSLAKALEYDWREIPEGDKDPLYAKHFAT